MADDTLFVSMNAAEFQSNLMNLLCRTAQRNGRIEVTNEDGTCCVMISKQELDDLERALAILSDSDAGRSMQRAIERFAAMSQQALPGGV